MDIKKNLPMNKLLVIATLSISFNVTCQIIKNQKEINIVGLWQSNTVEVTSAYLDSYRFYANHKFEFVPTGYNGLNRIIKIVGTYQILENEIKFHVQSLIEVAGGSIERSTTATWSDSWSIDGGKLITKKIKSNIQIASLEFCNEANHCISIDKRIYYKINE